MSSGAPSRAPTTSIGADWAFRLEHVQPLYDRSADIAGQGVNHVSPDVAAQRVALYKERNKILPGISRVERTFFEGVAQFLGDSQLEMLETVRLMRERANERRFDSTYPGFFFDLDSTLISLADAGIDVTPDDAQAYNDLMTAWRATAGSLCARHAEEARLGLEEGLVLRTEMFMAQKTGQTDLAADLERRFSGVREPATKTARRILELSTSSTRLVAAQLPTVARQRLEEDFQRAAYKPFFPDPCDLRQSFAVVEEQGISPDQRQRIQAVRDAWLTVDQSTNDHMHSDYLDWNEKTCTFKSYSADDYSRYSKRMLAAFDSRIANSESSIEGILEILNKSQRRAVTKHLEQWRKAVAQARDEHETTKSQYGGWPGPME